MQKKVKLFGIEISYKACIIIFIALGVIARVALFGSMPGGMNQDEAFAGYNGFSLMTSGKDNFGYHFPVYLGAWGHGMSVLNSVLMIPLMKVGGANVYTARAPQLIIGIISIYVFYKLLKKITNDNTALIGTLFFSICPWHIMMTRWGMDCNLLPGFLLFATYTFIVALEKPKYYLLSAFLFGLSLYCYAATWPFIPFIILCSIVYAAYCKKIKWSIYIPIAIMVLLILAIPLILFLAVNYDFINEISTDFISIPKLHGFRSGSYSITMAPKYFVHMIKIILLQTDNNPRNSLNEIGWYYHGMLIFGFVGLCTTVRQFVSTIKTKVFDGKVLILIQLVFSVLLGCLLDVNCNRINIIHIPIIFFICVGLGKTVEFLIPKIRLIRTVVTSILLLMLICFELLYFTSYREKVGIVFQEGFQEAVEYAIKNTDKDEKIFVMNVSENTEYSNVINITQYAKVAFFAKISNKKYQRTIKYGDVSKPHLEVLGLDRYIFQKKFEEAGKVCIIETKLSNKYEKKGYKIRKFKNQSVAIKEP